MSATDENIKLKFVGLPNLLSTYRGDGIDCNIKEPESCNVSVGEVKAAQLLDDFPQQWEVEEKELGGLTVEKFIAESDYRNKMVAVAQATKDIKIIYPNGKVTKVKAGSEITVTPPNHKKKTFWEKQSKCSKEGCGMVTKKSEKFCRHHRGE